MAGTPMFRWNGKQLIWLVNMKSKAIVEAACILVEKTAKASIGLVPSPSPPGHAPASVTGTLKARITHTKPVKTSGGGLMGKVGTNLEYARRLELGDKNQAPRPYLRPALHKREAVIKKMFGAK
jgi:HK97 gp10 family phage protein